MSFSVIILRKLHGWFIKYLRRKGCYIGIGGIVGASGKGITSVLNPLPISFIRYILVLMDLSLMFLMRKILKIFTQIKRSSRNAIIALALCLYK